LNGYQTQGENIADNGGIKESFRAYKKWAAVNGTSEQLLPGLDHYTPEQMFFINYANVWCLKATDQALINRIRTGVHSPGPYRTKGTTSNSREFADAFKCKSKQSNNPEKKCSVW
jgi:neprilysin